jgi:type I restriction enzyme R subunit
VNRLDTDDKDYGYIVDYMELFGNVTDAINVYTSELNSEGFTREEVEVNMKDRLKIAVDRLCTALETVESICDSVAFPRADIDYIHYFCGNTENPDDLKENEYKRMALYKAIVEYVRAYTNLKADFVNTKFTEKEIQRFHQKLEDYLNLREIIRKASGETIDLKAYEADMRFLIDTYIKAEESEKVSPFDDISLLQLMETDMDKAIDSLPKSVKGNQEAVAEIIENNVRSKIVEEHLLDPKYFDQMSVLLQELIEKRKQETISYQEYLTKMAELIKQVNKGKKDDVPASLNTKGKVALYHTLGDENLALACEEAVQYIKQEGFRENLAKQNLVKKAIYDVVKDFHKVEEVYKIVDAHKEEF